jgi:hypothetical protein
MQNRTPIDDSDDDDTDDSGGIYIFVAAGLFRRNALFTEHYLYIIIIIYK